MEEYVTNLCCWSTLCQLGFNISITWCIIHNNETIFNSITSLYWLYEIEDKQLWNKELECMIPPCFSNLNCVSVNFDFNFFIIYNLPSRYLVIILMETTIPLWTCNICQDKGKQIIIGMASAVPATPAFMALPVAFHLMWWVIGFCLTKLLEFVLHLFWNVLFLRILSNFKYNPQSIERIFSKCKCNLIMNWPNLVKRRWYVIINRILSGINCKPVVHQPKNYQYRYYV